MVLENVGEQALYMLSGGGQPSITLSEHVDGQWRPVASSKHAMCASVCAEPGQIACASIFQIPSVYGLLEGDSVELELGGEAWVMVDDPLRGQCMRPTSLGGSLQLEVCHSAAAQTWSEEEIIEAPAQSGVIDDGGEGALLVDAVCETVEFSVVADDELVVELAPQVAL